MSAFVVSHRHIDVIVTGALALLPNLRIAYGSESDIGQVLWAENVRSVLYRYPAVRETEEGRSYLRSVEAYRYARVDAVHPGALAKALDCLEYQSSECDDWSRRDACCLIERVKAALLQSIPGYEDAPWGYDEPA